MTCYKISSIVKKSEGPGITGQKKIGKMKFRNRRGNHAGTELVEIRVEDEVM
jgi:hypothetical protein